MIAKMLLIEIVARKCLPLTPTPHATTYTHASTWLRQLGAIVAAFGVWFWVVGNQRQLIGTCCSHSGDCCCCCLCYFFQFHYCVRFALLHACLWLASNSDFPRLCMHRSRLATHCLQHHRHRHQQAISMTFKHPQAISNNNINKKKHIQLPILPI